MPVQRFKFNPFFQSIRNPRSAIRNGEVLEFHKSLPGYQPAPLHVLPGLAADLGVGKICVKDESARFGLNAFKALGASYAIHRFLDSRAGGEKPVTFATATDGNHGRAVAWAARRLGHAAVIYVPGNTVPARIEAIRGEGARVVVVDGTYDQAVGRAAADSAANQWQVISDTSYPGYMEIPGWIMEGYGTLFVEAGAQMEQMDLPPPDLVFVQAGVGGLACAAAQHYHGPALVCVEPTEADGLIESICSENGEPQVSKGNQNSLMAGLNCGLPSLLAWPVLRAGIRCFLSVEDRYAVAAMRRFYYPASGDPRIISGETGAAGLGGLLALCEEADFRDSREQLGISRRSSILLINTEGDTDPVSFKKNTDQRSALLIPRIQ